MTMKNMAYWMAKNGNAPKKSSPAKAGGALAAVQGVEKGVKSVKGIKDTVDSLTGKTAMTDAMNAPISTTASGKEKSPAKAYGKKSPNKLMGLVKKKVNKELSSPAGKVAAKAATGGMA